MGQRSRLQLEASASATDENGIWGVNRVHETATLSSASSSLASAAVDPDGRPPPHVRGASTFVVRRSIVGLDRFGERVGGQAAAVAARAPVLPPGGMQGVDLGAEDSSSFACSDHALLDVPLHQPRATARNVLRCVALRVPVRSGGDQSLSASLKFEGCEGSCAESPSARAKCTTQSTVVGGGRSATCQQVVHPSGGAPGAARARPIKSIGNGGVASAASASSGGWAAR